MSWTDILEGGILFMFWMIGLFVLINVLFGPPPTDGDE